jgi:hypothetical protein
MKHAVEIGSGAMICIPDFMKMLIGAGHTDTDNKVFS